MHPRFSSVAVLLGLLACAACAQQPVSRTAQVGGSAKPRLVLGIVVDQMRYDLLTRFAARYGKDGFGRFTSQGYDFRQMHFNYMPTYTAPGHSSIYAGSAPQTHGIVGNDWYDRTWGRGIYCVTDTLYPSVGGSTESGYMSPANLLVPNLSDQLRAASPESKVIGLALKDRGAILPAGHKPTGAFWFDRKTGNWVTTTYYSKELPTWVQQYNSRKLPDSLLALGWQPLLPLDQYKESTPDSAPGEHPIFADKRTTLPYKLAKTGGSYSELLYTPHGNTITTQMALAAMAGEELGRDAQTDFLLVSYSSPDYAGHQFGPNSVEIQDMYLKLDRELAQLIAAAEQQAGAGNVLVFLTADHGVASLPEHAKAHNESAGRFNPRKFIAALDSHLLAKFGVPTTGKKYVLDYQNQQVYLNYQAIATTPTQPAAFRTELAAFARQWPQVVAAFTQEQILGGDKAVIPAIRNGYLPARSGDVAVVYEHGWFDGYSLQQTGTTHGSHYAYDTHVPFLLWGSGVKHGSSNDQVAIVDIAPTIAALVGIPAPPNATGRVLPQVVRK